MESLSQDGTQELLGTRWLSSLAGTEVIDVRLPTWAALWQELRKTASARVCVSSVVSDESESWQDIRVAKRFWTLSTRRGTIWCNEKRNGENRNTEKEVGSYIWEGTEHGVKGTEVKGERTCQKNSVPPYGHGERNKENWDLEI